MINVTLKRRLRVGLKVPEMFWSTCCSGLHTARCLQRAHQSEQLCWTECLQSRCRDRQRQRDPVGLAKYLWRGRELISRHLFFIYILKACLIIIILIIIQTNTRCFFPLNDICYSQELKVLQDRKGPIVQCRITLFTTMEDPFMFLWLRPKEVVKIPFGWAPMCCHAAVKD